jgi:plasmid maintenance system antidote protein VapI
LRNVSPSLQPPPTDRVETKGSIVWESLAKESIQKYSKPGLALKGARLRDGFTQKSLAKKSKLTQYNISKMENGSRPVGKEMARRLAKIFKTDHRVFL